MLEENEGEGVSSSIISTIFMTEALEAMSNVSFHRSALSLTCCFYLSTV